ncbi:Phosphatidate cytidylyltransferase, partial [Thalictrum thalictroides]
DSDVVSNKCPRSIAIIESSGYNLSEGHYTLRLKGGGGNESDTGSPQETSSKRTEPNVTLKRKKDGEDSDDTEKAGTLSDSPPVPSTHYESDIAFHCDAVEAIITKTRIIIADMITSTKIAKRWGEVLNSELTDVGKASRRVGSAGTRVLGVYGEQKADLKDAYRQIGALSQDLGSLREKHRNVSSEYEAILKRDIALAAALTVESSPEGTPLRARTPVFEQMDCDTIVVVDGPMSSYSDRVKKPAEKPMAKREAFPPLPTPRNKLAKTIKSRLGPAPPTPKPVANQSSSKSQNKKSMVNARQAAAEPRFEVVGGADAWAQVRDSVGQKLKCPKVRVRSTKTGIVLFPEDEATREALRSTRNLSEKLPQLPRLIVHGVDRSIDGKSLPALVHCQNDSLGLSIEEARSIGPLFKVGPRDGLTVNWVVECPPDTFLKLEGKSAYIGLTKCKMKLHNRTPQCFVCQKFGHTSKTCRSKEPVCRNCAGSHDSRSCTSDQVKCVNCRSTSH